MRSYSKPMNIGNKYLEGIWSGDPVIVQEKIDGSQISFGVSEEGVLEIRSRKIDLLASAEPGMFSFAVDYISSIADRLPAGVTFRGEYLRKPKHNTIAYGRVPANHIIIFDIDTGDQAYIQDPTELAKFAAHFGFEVVPYLGYYTEPPTFGQLNELINKPSILGGAPEQMMEGCVLKNYAVTDHHGKTMMAKHVSQTFKEKHTTDWKNHNPSQSQFVEQMAEDLRTEARWAKAVQHLREAGALSGTMKDIPLIMREINQDILEEEGEEIKERLFRHFWKENFSRTVTRGMPPWYKQLLAEEALG